MGQKNIGIKAKLLSMVAAAVFVLGGLTFFADYNTNLIEHHMQYLGSERLPLTELLGELRTATHATPRYLWVALANYSNKTEKDKAIEKVHHYIEMLDKAIELANQREMTGEDKAKLATIKESALKANGLVKKGLDILQQPNKETEMKEFMLTEMAGMAGSLTEEILSLNNLIIEQNKAALLEGQGQTDKSQMAEIILALICGVVFTISGFIFSTGLSKQMMALTEDVATASTQVASASVQLSRSAGSLSSAAQEQASSIEETSASLTEIQGMVDANIRYAETSNGVATKVHQTSEETRNFMESLSSAMNAILESNSRIEKLVKVIEEIGVKTEVIDDIVFKTQLLSFNASVEAERAGEHGRGFAVVAQEVGNLAQMSGKAATEISEIVKKSIKEAETVAQENKSRVEKGGQLADGTKAKMNEVISSIAEILDGTSRIVLASKEQSEGISQIGQSVESLNKATQETAGTAEESSSASEELASQSETLMVLVNDMKSLILGSSNTNMSELPKKSKVDSSKTKMTKIIPIGINKKTNSNVSNHRAQQQKLAVANDLETLDVPSHEDQAWEKI